MKLWRNILVMTAAMLSLASCKPSARQTTADAEQPTHTLRNVTKPHEHLFRHSHLVAFFCLAMNAFVGNLVTLQPNKHDSRGDRHLGYKKQRIMNKKLIITALLALVALAGWALVAGTGTWV